MHSFLKKFIKAENGTIAPIFAGALIPVLFLAGSGIDYTTQVKNSSTVLDVADAALLGIALDAQEIVFDSEDEEQLETEVKLLLDPVLDAGLSHITDITYSIDNVKFDDTTSQLKIDIGVSQETIFMGMANIETMDTTVTTAISLSPPIKTAMSVAFVLDKSGSMGWYGRWSTLNTAMNSLKVKFKELDPDKKYIRTGLTMFDSYGTSFYGMKWNMQKVVNKLNSYSPYGGTNSAPAMINAFNYLNTNTEENKHKKRNDSDLRKVIIFMTDGTNNSISSDYATIAACNSAKAADMEIYAVSFGAQGRAKLMLENCSSGDGYYISATNNAELLEAFEHIGETMSGEFYLSY